ncbi:hypothetical protein [Thiogranum longum]|nr:hypothetical protein [Thiogranum longum]
MENVAKVLEVWNSYLCKKIDLGGLISRNPAAHKWKATYRSIVLRELTFWRVTDLLNQMVVLSNTGHILGARILLRSTIETLGILIYLNQKMKAVLEGKEEFNAFSDMTSQLMLGSKNKTTKLNAINVTHTILEKWCEKKYPGIFEIYADLCESAHPNYEGVCFGYSFVNEKEYETVFENRWAELYASNLGELTLEFMRVFEEEYNNVWPAEYEKLEKWLVENDQNLEAARKGV